MTIERIIIIDEQGRLDREGWLAVRKPDVTASVVGGLWDGVHPYMTPLKLYLMHSGIEFDDSDDPVKRRGRIMEPAVRAAVEEERPEWRLEKCNSYYRDSDLRLGATPDFFIHGDPRGLGVLQTKSAAPHVYERDWEDGKIVPFWIQLQSITEAMLTEAAFAVVAVLKIHAFDLDCGIKEVPLYPGAEKRITDTVTQFWLDVAQGNEPEPDYNRDAELLKFIAPREVHEKRVDLSGDNELPALLDQREEIMANINAYETRKGAIETQIKFAMRDAERVTGLPDWSISWKTSHRKEHIVPAKDIRTLRIHHRTQEKANG